VDVQEKRVAVILEEREQLKKLMEQENMADDLDMAAQTETTTEMPDKEEIFLRQFPMLSVYYRSN